MIHMEGQEDQTQMIMLKGKRTKRQRPSSPFGGVGVTSSSSSAAYGGGGGGGGEGFEDQYANSFTSATTSGGGEVYESTEEEEDMANCLILLAQGDVPRQIERINERRLLINEIAAATSSAVTTASKAGFYVYECKTCNRTFPSFQALGGHRASHKKPKAMAAAAEEKKAAAVLPPTHLITTSVFDDQFEYQSQSLSQSKQFMNKALIQSNVHNHKVNKIHECSICGSEFTSGQALGGHMRRHRAAGAASTTTTTHVAMSAIDNNTKQRNNILPLDLNLPAPEDHDHHHHHQHHHHHHHQRESKFQFVPTQQSTLVFNAPSLVDCHY